MRTVLLGIAMLLAAACNRSDSPAPAAAAQGSGDAALKPVLSQYVVEFLRRNPTTNTYLGGAGLDRSLSDVNGTLRDYSPAALSDEDRWLTDTLTRLEAIAPESLSENTQIDREVARAQIAFQLHQHQVRKYPQRALDTFVVEPFRALDWQLQGMSQTGPTTYGDDSEWALVIRRLRAIPQFLLRAQEQLRAGVEGGNTPDPRMIARDGLDATAANAKYFAATLPSLAAARISGANRERLLADVQQASKAAAFSYQMMRGFVATTFYQPPHGKALKPALAGDRYAMGEAEYNWAIRNNLRLDTTAARLYDESWSVVEATRESMVDLARQIGAAQRWPLPADGNAAVRAVFDRLSMEYPKSDTEMLAWYRDAGIRLVDYGRKTEMFEVPADYKLDVVETPPPLQASIDGAAYYPAPPFQDNGVGRFYVTPTHNDPAALMTNNRAALPDLAAHEGFPGHDWYYKVLTQYRAEISPVRWLTPGSVEDSSSMWEDSLPAEGWGLYAEALMAEPQPGAPNGFYTPAERLYQLQGKLYRDLRVRIDTGIHTGRMSYDEAVMLFSEVVDFLPGSCMVKGASAAKRASCEGAERAIFRYSKWPTQAITYRLGKDQIYALRGEAANALGTRFSPKAFHLLFIRQGTIPSGYFHDVLMRQVRASQSMPATN